MKRFIGAVIIAGIFLALPMDLYSQTIDEVIKRANEMQDNISTDEENESLIKMLKEVAAKYPDNFNLQWRTARAICLYADRINLRESFENAKGKMPVDMDDLWGAENISLTKVSSLGAEARVYAEKAVVLNPDRVEGYYYNAMAISMYSLGKGIITALREGIRPKLIDSVKKAIERDKIYNGAGPLRIYGRYFYKVPWPYKDKRESERLLQESLSLAPNNLRSLLYLGDTLYAIGKKKEAEEMWKRLINTHASEGKNVLEGVFKEMARMRLDRIGGK